MLLSWAVLITRDFIKRAQEKHWVVGFNLGIFFLFRT